MVKRCPVVLVGGIQCGVYDSFKGVFHVLRRQLPVAVAPEDPRPQRELDVSVVDLLDRLCSVGLPLPAIAGLEGDQPVKERARQFLLDLGETEWRIENLYIGEDAVF